MQDETERSESRELTTEQIADSESGIPEAIGCEFDRARSEALLLRRSLWRLLMPYALSFVCMLLYDAFRSPRGGTLHGDTIGGLLAAAVFFWVLRALVVIPRWIKEKAFLKRITGKEILQCRRDGIDIIALTPSHDLIGLNNIPWSYVAGMQVNLRSGGYGIEIYLRDPSDLAEYLPSEDSARLVRYVHSMAEWKNKPVGKWKGTLQLEIPRYLLSMPGNVMLGYINQYVNHLATEETRNAAENISSSQEG